MGGIINDDFVSVIRSIGSLYKITQKVLPGPKFKGPFYQKSRNWLRCWQRSFAWFIKYICYDRHELNNSRRVLCIPARVVARRFVNTDPILRVERIFCFMFLKKIDDETLDCFKTFFKLKRTSTLHVRFYALITCFNYKILIWFSALANLILFINFFVTKRQIAP